MGLSDSELLLCGGAVMMIVSVVGMIIAIVALTASGRRLKKKLESEFGKKRH